MEENLKSVLIKYRDCTLEIMKLLEKNDIDSVDDLVRKRQNVLDEAMGIKCSKEETKLVNEELKLQQLQDQVNVLIFKRLKEIKDAMQKNSDNRHANIAYRGVNGNMPRIFSKKI
ncbi:hypothetical protein ACJDU8_16230 [Clostridium sp. WILCCON 0269]|uniref:Flagellar protein FliT n=1 Tax=Candidatus Clostridium eludens TaxID=3381663 RepID=A0ABW8SPJ2_9CLOT